MPLLEMRGITKRFPGVLANDNIDLEVKAAEVHTILGENGAGKSTLMNILCGLYRPTSGEIFINDKRMEFSSARDAMAVGIGMVHQHFMLIPSISVVENCLIGAKEYGTAKLDIKTAAQKIITLSELYGLKVDPCAKVAMLSVGEQQRVEIVKTLFRGAKLLIMDEPTSVLTPQETEELFAMIKKLTKDGMTVLFISHKLHEIIKISDRVTILQHGRNVGSYDIAECCATDLARMMVGREVNFGIEKCKEPTNQVVLEVKSISLKHAKGEAKVLDDINFELHCGEILGVAGVDGNGQAELVECLVGLKKATQGGATYKGWNILQNRTRAIMSDGVSHIPQDRQASGLVMQMPLSENFILQDYYKPEFGKGAFIDWKYVEEYSDRLIKDFNIKTPGRWELAKNLSGGNQQKVILAREISRNPRLLIAMHPTRGLDVGAIEYIHEQIIRQRDEGVAVLMVSTELEEILKLSDRVIVMFEGRIMGIVTPEQTSIEEMGLMMGGTPLSQIRQGAG